MPRTSRDSRPAVRGRRRGSGPLAGTAPIVGQISQIVAANQLLQRENKELQGENERLKAQLREIGDALNVLTGSPRQRRGRRAAEVLVQSAPPRRTRKPITDPVILEKRRQALARARAARAEKLAAARAASASNSSGQ